MRQTLQQQNKATYNSVLETNGQENPDNKPIKVAYLRAQILQENNNLINKKRKKNLIT